MTRRSQSELLPAQPGARRNARRGIRDSRFKPVSDLLASHLSGPQPDADTARSRALMDSLRSCLPPTLLAHCQLARYADTTLTLTMDSPAWATRLRFSVDQLLAHTFDEGVIKRVNIQVRPSRPQATTTAQGMPRAARLSAAAARHLMIAARNTADPELRALWEQLASRAGPPPEDI